MTTHQQYLACLPARARARVRAERLTTRQLAILVEVLGVGPAAETETQRFFGHTVFTPKGSR